MAQDITLLGASYSAVPAVVLPKTGGGSAAFTDVTDTTAAAEDVASGKYFYAASGERTAGTASSGAAMESGSFIASSPLDAVTIPVASKKSYVAFWIHGMTGNMDLSGAPYGNNHLVYFYADEAIEFCGQGQSNYNGQQWTGAMAKIMRGEWDANHVVFGNDSIIITKIRAGGVAREMVDGATYDWKAW